MPKKLALYLDALRLGRWPRSLAILPGFVAALVLGEQSAPTWGDIGRLVLAFLLTWAISTANYIVNEITDAPYDAHHPAKRHRPLVQQQISARLLLVLWLLLTALSAVAGRLWYSDGFVLSLGALLVAGLLYNIPPVRLKDIPFLDSTAESANNPIRFLIGWTAISAQLPPSWLLLAWWLFGNFLMIGKRVAEKKFLSAEESEGYRRSLARVSSRNLIVFMIFNAVAFLISLTIFLSQSDLLALLWGLPLIVGYLVLFFRKALQDRDGAEDPEWLLKNPVFAGYTVFLIVFFLLIYYWRQ